MEYRNELERLASEPDPDSRTILADLARPEGKTGRKNSRLNRKERARRASDDLLKLLKHHHDFDVPKPVIYSFPVRKVAEVENKIKERRRYQKAAPKPIEPIIPGLDGIRRVICDHFMISRVEFDSPRREQRIVIPRQMAFYLAVTLTKSSFPAIGRYYGGKDHTTVLHGYRKIKKLVMADWQLAYDVAVVESYL